jgi:phospholipid/cholesterol/gamma-HCH transport system permease protein
MIVWIDQLLADLGGCVLFAHRSLLALRRNRLSWHAFCEEVWKITSQSVTTTALAGFFVGAIMTIQFALQVRDFGALGYLGGLATSGTIREVGPLLIAFMLSGKVGAFTSAELGTMRVTEQIDAIRCLGADPIQELIVPRLVGIVFSSFFLLTAGLVASVVGGLWLGVLFAGIQPEEYVRHIPTIVTWPSIASGLFKCFVFAVVLAAICTYKGYTTTGGAKGVGRAVVSTAVTTMVGLVIADCVTSLISDAIVNWFVG